VADPAATGVTATFAVVWPAAMTTGDCTVAIAVLDEFTFTDRPPVGAGADKVNVRFVGALMVCVAGKLSVSVTVNAVEVPVVYPAVAVAVMVDVPKVVLFAVTTPVPTVWPAAIVNAAGGVAMLVLLLCSVTVTPPAGAATVKVAVMVWVPPRPMVAVAGVRFTTPAALTVTVAVTAAIPAAADEAVMVAVPGVTPVTGTLTCVAPAAKVALATVATLVFEDVTVMVNPLGDGAGEDRFNCRFCVAVPVMVRVFEVKLIVSPTVTLVGLLTV